MPIFGTFAPSVSAMTSQAYALDTIGSNIANINTGGYRRTDTHFSSLLSAALIRQGGPGVDVTEVSHSTDYGGIQPKDFMRISQQGRIESSSNPLDLAISGKGFFILNSALDGAGQTLYTRDGSFQTIPGPTTTATGNDGNTITPDTAYLADKNGYLVQGYIVGSDGTFPTSGTLQDIRVDPYAFSDQLKATTTGNITFNLPANADPTPKQVDLIQIAGTPEAGDIYSATVDGTTVNYTATTTDTTLNDMRDGLLAAINADTTVSGTVTATAGGNGAINLTANDINTSFTASATATDGGLINDNTASQTTLVSASAPGDQSQTYGYSMIDSTGATQNITLLFDKVDTNTWEMRTESQQTPVAQVDTATLSGTVETGDVYSVTVNGTTANYTVQTGDTTLDDVRDGLIASISAIPSMLDTVTPAAGSGTGALTLTAVNAGTAFTSSVSTTDPGLTQVDTITMGGTFGALEAGDTYSATVDGTTVTYTVTGADTLATARTNFIAAINGDPTVGALVTAAPGGGAGDITLTANTPGTPFTSSAAATDVAGGVNDSTASDTTTTAGSNSDNAISVATTTDNVPSEVFSDPTTLTFDGAGNMTSADSVDLSFDFGSGATGSMTLNLNDITQFAGSFQVFDFNRDGFGQAQLQSFSYDKHGVINGKFSDGTSRPLYQIPLAEFVNADGLSLRNGNTFAETPNSGSATVVTGDEGYATFLPSSYELSNVDLAQQFSQLTVVQTAYNADSKVFTTLDDMLVTARDLKR